MTRNAARRLAATLLPFTLLAAACGGVEAEGRSLPIVSAGESHVCALRGGGEVWCWGGNDGGALGDGTTISWDTPHRVAVPEGVTFEVLDAGTGTTCALDTNGAAWCWGTAWDDPTTTSDDALLPTPVDMPPRTAFTDIATSFWTTCALATDGSAWCWGDNYYGQLGNNTVEESLLPVEVPTPEGVAFTDITLGGGLQNGGFPFACALAEDGVPWCWGPYAGVDEDDPFRRPVAAAPQNIPFPEGVTLASIEAGDTHTCGLTSDGAVWCWGTDAAMALGVDSWDPVDRGTPLRIPSDVPFVSIGLGENSACAVSGDGGIWCWGSATPLLPKRFARMGGTGEPVAIDVPLEVNFTAISMGGLQPPCAVTDGGDIWCWERDERDATSDERFVLVDFDREPVAQEGTFTPRLIPWTEDVPVWPLSLTETAPAFAAFQEDYLDVLLAGGMPERCATSDPNGDGRWGSFEQCELKFLAAQVPDEAATRLLQASYLTVFETWGNGPVQTVWAWDWSDFHTNVVPDRDVIATPEGLITELYGWHPLVEALAAAYASETFQEVASISPDTCFLHTFGDYGSVLGAPEGDGTGWTIPLSVHPYCGVPVKARFALGFSSGGILETARFVDFCAIGRSSELAVEDLVASLPPCGEPLHEGTDYPGVRP